MKPWPSEALEDVVCNLCGSHDSRARMVIDGFTIVRCNVCSLDYLNPRLKQGILQEIYDDGYYRSLEGYARDPNSPQEDEDSFYGYNEYLAEKKSIKATFKRRLDIVEKFIEPGTLLDVGCAMGFVWTPPGTQGPIWV